MPVTTPDRLDAGWLSAPGCRAVIAALHAVRPGSARYVGGCVRNTLMGRPVDDIDIATQLTPDAVTNALKAAGIRCIPTGIEHGTVTAVFDSQPFEITTLRRDVETDGRRAVVAFTEDWAEDAARRDFRLNALYAEPGGTLHDPTGGGLEDAANGRVIFIGDADERLREDYLRILRFFRFNAWYGAGIDADGLAACERQSGGLQQIAAERIWKELEKLLRAPAPHQAVKAMADSGVLTVILPEASVRDAFAVAEARTGDPLIRLMALLPREAAVAAAVARSLRLSNRDAGRLKAWSTIDIPDGTSARLRALAYRAGKEPLLDWLTVSAPDPLYHKARTLLENWDVPALPVRGQDLLDRGWKGPEIGAALKALEDAWIESDFGLSKADLLARLIRN